MQHRYWVVLSNPAPGAEVVLALTALRDRGSPWPVVTDLSGATWRPLADLADPLVREDVAGRISGTVGGCEPRVAVSTLVLGLAARLWAVALGSVALTGVLPDLSGFAFTDDRGSVQLGLARAGGWRTRDPRDLHEVVVTRALGPVIAGVPLSSRLLWGNVASALVGAGRVLDLPVTGLVEELLDLPPLRGELDAAGRRTTCCLFYRVPGAGLCGDCVLDAVPAT
jgi:iron complex transport system ATP-binding protein